MRTYFYILAGIASALIGWNLGHIFLTDMGLLKQLPELVLFPCIALSLAVGMVLTEMFISNPTRPKLTLRIARFPLAIAGGLGILAGLIAGGISQILFVPEIPIDPRIVRILGWLLIGTSTGIAEGVTWRWHSIEAGDPKRYRQRLLTSVVAGSAASLAAALIFEILRQIVGTFPEYLRGAEDPIGFSILGILLGFVFSFSTSPSYMAALRAGAGFEYTGQIYDEDINPDRLDRVYPRIDKETDLKFVSNSDSEEIEEGLSIQLPEQGKLTIGSGDKAQILIPDLPDYVADLEIKAREVKLIINPKYSQAIEVNGNRVNSHPSVSLKHNSVITFYPEPGDAADENKFYRFIYYNRFLDPQA